MTEIIPGLQGDVLANYRKGTTYVAGKNNENNTIINHHGLFSIHMSSYYNSIIKGVSTVMISYSSWNGIKMHANRELITGFLKNTLRFKGIDRITTPAGANYSYSVQVGINVGIDMPMVPNDYPTFINDMMALIKSNVVAMTRIDNAVTRILRVKFIMGMLENFLADLTLVDQLRKKVSQSPPRCV